MVGLRGFEPLTFRMSSERSNQLSYRPIPQNSTSLESKNQLSKLRLIFSPNLV